MSFTCELANSVSPTDPLWAEWDRLLGRVSPELQLFGPEWYRTWSQTSGAAHRWTGELAVLCVRDNQRRLAGVMPVGSQRIGPLRAHSLAGCWQPWRTLLAAKDLEAEVGCAVADWIARSSWNLLRLGPVVRSSAAHTALLDELKRRNPYVHLQRTAQLAVCSAPETWEEYRTEVLGGKFYRKLGYYERRLGRQGELNIVHYRQPSDAETERMVENLADIERRSWLATASNGYMRFVPADRKAMWQRLIAEWLAPRDLIDCWVMSFGGRPISFCFTLTSSPARYVIANQYDEAYKSHRTGSTLYRYMMEDGINRGVRHFDFGDGELHYKRHWGARYADSLDTYLVLPQRSLAHVARTTHRVTQTVNSVATKCHQLLFRREDAEATAASSC